MEEPSRFTHQTILWGRPVRRRKFRFAGRSVCEIGAGCGLLGISLATLSPSRVFLTDQAPLLDNLRANVALNLSTEEQRLCDVRELTWGNADHIAALGAPFDFVVGSDIVYEDQSIEPLLQTCQALSSDSSTVLLANERRDPVVYERFLQAARSGGWDVDELPLKRIQSDGFVESVSDHAPCWLNEVAETRLISGTPQISGSPEGMTDVICSICQEQLKTVRGTLKCGHSFCAECIQEWATVKAECPQCKSAFTAIDIADPSGGHRVLEVDPTASTGIPGPDNFEGLDHSFLISEVRVLLGQAREAEQKGYRPGLPRVNSLQLIRSAVERLVELDEWLSGLGRVDPRGLLDGEDKVMMAPRQQARIRHSTTVCNPSARPFGSFANPDGQFFVAQGKTRTTGRC
ncbi:putative protein-lysine methyltransferase METTL21D [Paratrimastix pyriformis]|uniref:RING-type domain-containing protein n=1 Tax=Paratrimastix pyriformis TaxID=342808 RepID=A0ABQ8UW97_9EUKA|nr:putative protein-lysine methyltransferase METTL21D [Paratrimastix pyriformis]